LASKKNDKNKTIILSRYKKLILHTEVKTKTEDMHKVLRRKIILQGNERNT
jgi:hypothetical protein